MTVVVQICKSDAGHNERAEYIAGNDAPDDFFSPFSYHVNEWRTREKRVLQKLKKKLPVRGLTPVIHRLFSIFFLFSYVRERNSRTEYVCWRPIFFHFLCKHCIVSFFFAVVADSKPQYNKECKKLDTMFICAILYSILNLLNSGAVVIRFWNFCSSALVCACVFCKSEFANSLVSVLCIQFQ